SSYSDKRIRSSRCVHVQRCESDVLLAQCDASGDFYFVTVETASIAGNVHADSRVLSSDDWHGVVWRTICAPERLDSLGHLDPFNPDSRCSSHMDEYGALNSRAISWRTNPESHLGFHLANRVGCGPLLGTSSRDRNPRLIAD